MPPTRKKAPARKKRVAKSKKKTKTPAKKRRKASGTSDHIEDLLNRIQPEFLDLSARQMTRSDVATLYDHRKAVLEQFRAGSVLERFQADAAVLLELVEDHNKGRYGELPYWSLAVITFSLLYVLRPVDIIPDTLPGIGQLDDALVVALCLNMTKKDVYDYTTWRLDTSPARRRQSLLAAKKKTTKKKTKGKRH